MGLDSILETLNQAANAMASVLGVDVLIVDSNLVRLVATGAGMDQLGSPVDRKSVFAYALQQGESFIIEDPRTHEACRHCGNKANCTEKAELCCPIRVNGEVAGVIGLIAFNETARNRMLERKDSYLSFVRQMAGLIASKAQENLQYQKTEKLASELETLVEQIGQGVLIADASGRIMRGNTQAYRLMKLQRGTELRLNQLLPPHCLQNGLPVAGEHTLTPQKGKTRLLCRIRPFQSGGELNGHILVIDPLNEVFKDMNRMLGYGASADLEEIIGNSPAISRARELAKKSAKGKSTILILGESGTGKELFARAIHGASSRAREPFVPINCAAIPDHLLESELFGYEEGAFSGARKGGKIGKFELADRGTLFLDEIGDMPLHLQTKLLRVLEENVIDRVGSSERTPVDVRIIAATHQHLENKVRAREFREDLYYRLNVIPISIPALRERVQDIPLLAEWFNGQIALSRGEEPRLISVECLRALQAWSWPGNVRELQNAIAYAAELSSGPRIESIDLPERMRPEPGSVPYEAEIPQAVSQPGMAEQSVPGSDEAVVPLSRLEQQEIQKALKLYGKDIEGAAKALGISRATMYRKMKA